jgi:hypothetical protein
LAVEALSLVVNRVKHNEVGSFDYPPNRIELSCQHRAHAGNVVNPLI